MGTRNSPGKKLPLIITVIVITAVLLVTGYFFSKTLTNPLRTLKQFPIETYYDHPSSLEGTRFKATLRAGNQIGWKKEIGRLVNFRIEPSGDPIVALVPPKFETIAFEPDEAFDAELLVEEGGLIKVNYLEPR